MPFHPSTSRRSSTRRFVLSVFALVAAFTGAFADAAHAGPVLTGRVFDAEGSPLAGARVSLSPAVDRYPMAELLLAGEAGPEPVVEVRSGEDGGFRVVAPAIGMWRLAVFADGYVPAQIRLRPLLEDLDLEPVSLAADLGFDARVLDLDGEPAAGVGVVAYRAVRSVRSDPSAVGFDLGIPVWHGGPELARTDDDGAVRLAATAGETLWIQAVVPGRPQILEKVEIGEAARVEPVVLRPAESPVGRLVALDVRGRPVADVLVFADRQPLPIARTDARGGTPFALAPDRSTRLDLLGPAGEWGLYTLATADAEDHPTGTSADGERGAAPEGGEVELLVRSARAVSGRVEDRLSGRPLPGALVWPAGAPARAVVVGRGGGFDLEISAEADTLTAVSAGYRPDRQRLELENDVDLPLVALRPSAVCGLGGRVVDPEGEGLADVELLVLPESSAYPRGREWTLRTDARGGFRVERLACGIEHVLYARRSGFVTIERDLPAREPSAQSDDIVVTLEPGRRAVGFVLDAAETPLAGAVVELTQRGRYGFSRRTGPDDDSGRTTTDAEGHFVLEDLSPGRFDLRVAADGFADAEIPGIEVLDAPVSDLGTVYLDRGVLLVGTVVDDLGDAIAGARVVAEMGREAWRFGLRPPGEDEAPGGAITDEEGRFVLEGLAPGAPIGLGARAEGYAARRLDAVEPGGDPVRLVLPRLATLGGRVVDEAGWPVEGARLFLHYPSGAGTRLIDRDETRTDADGRFEIGGIAGPAALEVSAKSHLDRRLDVVLPAPGVESPPLEIVLGQGFRLDGRVLDALGRPVARAWIVAQAGDTSSSSSASTDGAGSFRLEGLAAGQYTLHAHHQDRGRLSEEIVIDRDDVVELRYPEGEAVEGRVVDEEGRPIAGAEVIAVADGDGGFAGSARTDAAGAFTLSGLTRGRYRFLATADSHARPDQVEPVTIDGPVPDLEIALRRGTTLRGRIEGLDVDELARLRLVAQGPVFGNQAWVDFNGDFEIAGLVEGAYLVVAELPGEGRRATVEVEVSSIGEPSPVVIEFLPGLRFAGVVRVDGAPRSGLPLLLVPADPSADPRFGSRRFQSTSVQGGAFRFVDLPAGEYDFLVIGESGLLHRRRIPLSYDLDLVVDIESTPSDGSVQ